MEQKSPEAFRTISEVAEWLGVPTHVLRFWESRFSQVKPVKRAGGRRYYRPADMELLGGIRKLLHEDGMTIRGVQKLLREQGVKHVAGMSPPLDLGAETEDVTPSNVVDLSERRGEEAEEAGDDGWEAEAEETGEADVATQDAPPGDGSEDVSAEPADEAAAFWQDEGTTMPEDATEFESPDQVAFHAHDAEPDAFEGADSGVATPPADFTPPEPDPEPMPQSEETTGALDTQATPDLAAQDAGPKTVETEPSAPPAPATRPAALAMPDIGPDPDDGAFYPDSPPVAARLRAARDAEVEFPLETLWTLAERLGALAGRTGARTSPRP